MNYLMAILKFNRKAHIAFSTMKEPVPSSKSANTTPIAVILIFVFIIKEVAFEAGVFTKAHMALLASCLHWLTCITQNTY